MQRLLHQKKITVPWMVVMSNFHINHEGLGCTFSARAECARRLSICALRARASGPQTRLGFKNLVAVVSKCHPASIKFFSREIQFFADFDSALAMFGALGKQCFGRAESVEENESGEKKRCSALNDDDGRKVLLQIHR